jgi:hypothetical protein
MFNFIDSGLSAVIVAGAENRMNGRWVKLYACCWHGGGDDGGVVMEG